MEARKGSGMMVGSLGNGDGFFVAMGGKGGNGAG